MSDRKKRLEEIRRRKQELEKQLLEKSGGATSTITSRPVQDTPAQPFHVPSHTTTNLSTNISSEAFDSVVSTHSKKQSLRSVSFFDDPAKNSLMTEIQIKKINASLRTHSFEQTLIGIYPDVKEGFSQYELPKELEPPKKEDPQSSNKKQDKDEFQRPNTKRFTMRKSSVEDPGKKQEEEIKQFMPSEEKRKEFLEKNESKLKTFIDSKKDYFEQSLFVNDIFDLCETYYDEDEENMDLSKRTLVTNLCDFTDESTAGRVVTSLEWSAKHIDMFLAAFSQSNDSYQQRGLIELWSLAQRKAPEYSINCQTEITSAIFHNLNPKLVVGGSFTGQIMLWDIKSKPIPIQKTPLGVGSNPNGKTHCLPITSLNVFGTETNSTIISLSNDGVLCQWSLANFSRPVYRVELKRKIGEKEKIANFNEVAVLTTAFNPNQPNTILIGSDDNIVYNVSTVATETRENIISTFQGHDGPIYALDNHPVLPEDKSNHSNLFISSSADWTTKLWSTDFPCKPLVTFDMSDDYIYSAKWHPINPSLFVSGDGTGNLDFWDLNKDRELPVFRYNLKCVINKVSWSSDGKKLAVGDATGRVTIFNSEKDVYNVKPEDHTKFDNIINGLMETAKEQILTTKT